MGCGCSRGRTFAMHAPAGMDGWRDGECVSIGWLVCVVYLMP